MKRFFAFLAVAMLATTNLVLFAPQAGAVFPGTNFLITFTANRDGNSQIYTMGADGSTQTRATVDAATDDGPKFNPVSGFIVFASDQTGNGDIYVTSAGQDIRLTTSNAVENEPAPAANGKKIAFMRVVDGHDALFVMNANGSGAVRIVKNTGSDSGEPVWSPKGDRIAFYRRGPSKSGIYTVKPDGTGLARVTTSANGDYDPDWNPTGTRIAFTRAGASDNLIYSVRANGTGLKQISPDGAYHYDPAWSPDGTLIAFMAIQGDYEIYSMSAAGGGIATQLTNNVSDDSEPDWLGV